MSCGSLGEDYQRKRKVRAVIVSTTVLGIPGRTAAYRDDFVCRKPGAV